MIVAVLDLGSNTVKLTVARLGPEGVEPLEEASEITRVGEGLDKNGYLLDAAMQRTEAQVARFAEQARAAGAQEIRCVGTAGLRGASNAAAFLAAVEASCGVQIEIIDGLREAELAFRAPAAMFGPGPVLVVDMGGRSTELISGRAGALDSRVSMEMGAVRLTERFLPDDPPPLDQVAALRAHVRSELAAQAPEAGDGATVVGVSGTIISLLGLSLGLSDLGETVERAESTPLHAAFVEQELERLRRISAAERIQGTVVPKGRADVIVAGAALLAEIMKHYGAETMRVTHRGVRYGLLEEMRAAL